MNRGSRLAVCSLSSMKAAVVPPTDASTPVPATAVGMTSSRSVCTRSSVASSCGPVVGTTEMTAASPRSFSDGRDDRRHAVGGGEIGRHPLDGVGGGGGAARTGQVDRHEEGAVGAGTEALADEVVGPAAGQLGRGRSRRRACRSASRSPGRRAPAARRGRPDRPRAVAAASPGSTATTACGARRRRGGTTAGGTGRWCGRRSRAGRAAG